ncbi:MAG: His/Gly/Thr/Pro-type tRNA ligase C-terminal domain-containing protein, partial [Bosea sp. (in: a-proteobacteria)]|nr:His/Gly/Thr/Pro-type tRNA ligase C-terminal domain-containing protein [Bosea sp. (in: a-proteobacteria)]
IVWPDEIAPFDVAVLNLKLGDAETDGASRRIYEHLLARGYDALYDDTDARPGGKFATADLIGVPWQIIVGPKGLAEGKVEIKRRTSGERELVSIEEALARFKGKAA